MKRLFAIASAVVISLLVGSPSYARAGDKNWATCVWNSDPEGAEKWLSMPVPAWQDEYGKPAEFLGLRLIAECDPTPADPNKPNRTPNWKSLQQALKSSRPKVSLAPAPQPISVQICEHFAVNQTSRALFLAEVVRVAPGETVVVYQMNFDVAGTGAISVVDRAGRKVSFQFGGAPVAGSTIRMPQDTLISSPAPGFTAEKACRAISADGKLIDA